LWLAWPDDRADHSRPPRSDLRRSRYVPVSTPDLRPGSHQIPGERRSEAEQTLLTTRGLVGEPSDAERSRTLLAYGRFGSLATTSIDPPGYPFGSLVGFAVDEVGRPVLCLSDLAEHSRNLLDCACASLMVTEAGDASTDPLARGRVTLIGDLLTLEGQARNVAQRLYRAAHPSAFYSDFDDFRYYRLQIVAVRYVGGFGRMSWVGATEYAAAEPDPLNPHIQRIVEHMNADHADALVAYCRVFGDLPETGSARMVHIDRYGFDMLAGDTGEGDRQAVRIGFGQLVDTPDEVRAIMIGLLSEARAALGKAGPESPDRAG
jgi:heme iron utilization protein